MADNHSPTRIPTRILHVTFNMGFGGTEQVIRQLVTNLNSQLFQCEIACIDGEVGAIGKAMEADNGITIHSRKRGPGLDWKTILWLRRLIKSGDFDFVHCHQYSPYTYGWFAHWGTGAKVVFTEHGRFHPDQHRKKARLINPLIALTSHRLVAISAATRNALIEYEYMPAARIKVIYNGITPLTVEEDRKQELLTELGIKPGEVVIGTVARLDSVKNQPMMLQTTRTLIDQGYKVRLLLVGDGPERQNLEAERKRLTLDNAVIFTGFQSKPADYLSLMDIFLLPSFTEGTSMTLLEAMSLGIPTVATRVGGTPEIVEDKETGFLIESDNQEAFTRAIKNLLDQPEQRKKMGSAAKARFEQRFSVKQMVDQYQEGYGASSPH
ncbi:glycosyltransferase [Marinobacter sp. BSs20148]|uniref:glycosyltransferase n=1 Tax=Marinobacter sp. BSs20148 TaxID=490759 RepID=UPI0002776B9C|nr:glycosyltransferase [Marinobacter sp. BSs20148]AFP31111.1 putative glycosyltransferase ypjH [Marinobacter sp. BSs20148]